MNGKQPTNACIIQKIGLNFEFVSTFSVAKNGGWNGFVPSVVEHTISCSAKWNTFVGGGGDQAQLRILNVMQ